MKKFVKIFIPLLFGVYINVVSQYDYNEDPTSPFTNINCDDSEQIYYIDIKDVHKNWDLPGDNEFVGRQYYCYKSSGNYYTTAELLSYNNIISSAYNGATIVGYNTFNYNCHAYAWHISEGGEIVWLDDLVENYEDFYSTTAYIQKTSGSKSFPNVLKVTYPEQTNHSAITTENENIFISKWDVGWLIKHEWDEHPYTACSYNELKFWGKNGSYPGIKLLYDMTYYNGTYILGENIRIEKIKIDLMNFPMELAPELNTDWITIKGSNSVEVIGPFDVKIGSNLLITNDD